MRRLYCGGTFAFDTLQNSCLAQASQDYRSLLLGGSEHLLHSNGAIRLNAQVEYIGPFYYETEDMIGQDIVQCEMGMVHLCTDAIFLLDDAAGPGTICELTMASMLHKRVHIFYLRRPDNQETESALHTPCWYPILHSTLINDNTHLHQCYTYPEAASQIATLVRRWGTDG